jgi:polyprenyl-phospho-N-acetylgalactosaminyl synthase
MTYSSEQIYVVVPCYNEGRMIGQVLEGLLARGFRVVTVDDGSRDNTVAEALRYPVHVLSHPFNLGQGAALQTGITFALRQPDCRCIVTFDADGQHDPGDILRLVETLETRGVDVVLGSRFYGSTRPPTIRTSRLVLLKTATWLTRLTTGLELTDTHNGLRAFTRAAAAKIQLTQNRMSHASEILTQISRQKLAYVEAPVSIQYTAYSMEKGQSIWNAIDILWDSFVGGLK